MLKSIKATLLAGAATLATLLPAEQAQAQANPFLGQMMLFGGNFCPRGWAYADGQLMPIATYSALFSLYGTLYGGDGRSTFGLPDLRGRSPINRGHGPGLSDHPLGQRGGVESVTLGVSNMPSHSHSQFAVTSSGDRGRPSDGFLASGAELIYHEGPADTAMASGMIGHTGGGQSVYTQSPYLTMSWCVAIEGIYPSRS